MKQDGSAEVAALRWVRDTIIGQAACLTLIRSRDTSSAARAFGGDPGEARRLSLSAARDEFGDRPWVAMRSTGSGLLAAEVNGWQGSRPEVLRRVSPGTRAVSAYWNVNGTARFSYSVDGRLLTAFDATFPDHRTGEDPDGLEAMRAALPWDDADPVALMLALAARLTRDRAEPAWFDGTFDVVPVTPVAEAVEPSVDPDTQPLTYGDPPLAWALRHADDERRRNAAAAAARYAVRVAGLETNTDVARALRDAGDAAEADLAELAAAMDEAARKSRGDTRPGGRFWAVTALREAMNPLPMAAGFKATEAAGLAASAFGSPAGELRGEVLDALGDPQPPSGSLGLHASPGPLPTDRYLWTGVHWLAPAGCITYAQDLTPATVARAFGGDPDGAETGVPRLFAHRVAAIRAENGWAVAVEHHERVGTRYQRLPPGTAVTLAWSARGRSWLRYTAEGRFLAMLDPQRPGQRSGEDPAALDEFLADLRLGSTAGNAASYLPTLLVLAARLTGLDFTPEMLDQSHILVRLPDRPGTR